MLIANAADLLGRGTGHALSQIAGLPAKTGEEPACASEQSARNRLGDTAAAGGQIIAQQAGTGAEGGQSERRARRLAQNVRQRAAVQMGIASIVQAADTRFDQVAAVANSRFQGMRCVHYSKPPIAARIARSVGDYRPAVTDWHTGSPIICALRHNAAVQVDRSGIRTEALKRIATYKDESRVEKEARTRSAL